MSKRAVIILLIALLVSYKYYQIQIPIDSFDAHLTYKSIYFFGDFFVNLARLFAKFDIGKEASNIRIFDSIDLMMYVDEFRFYVEKNNTKISNVNVRIYSQLKRIQSMSIIIWYHGGGSFLENKSFEIETLYKLIKLGFALGGQDGLNHNDYYLSRLAVKTNSIIILADYKLAPEYPYPQPINDCYEVAKYVLENPLEFNGNPDQIILAGESAGGNAVAVITQRLLKEKRKLPKFQILIYPWLQMVDYRLPSARKYYRTGFFSIIGLEKFTAWYLGINQVDKDLEYFLTSNSHLSFIDDDLKKKISLILNPDLIPEEYKKGKNYYNSDSESVNAEYSIPDRFKNNNTLKEILKKAFQPDISPILADSSDLKGLPKAFILACEWDSLKDESFIYAERLKNADVDVKIGFYEKGFHGIIVFPFAGFEAADHIFNDISDYINANK